MQCRDMNSKGRLSDRDEPIIQMRRIYKIVRRQRGKRYTYARLSLEGGALDALGLKAGQMVRIELRDGEIRIRPSRRCAVRNCGRAALAKGYCLRHRSARRV